MKKDIAELWATTLESGRFEQGRQQLNRENKLCCLGVLCELAIENGVDVKKEEYRGEYRYNERNLFPPNEVTDWCEISIAGEKKLSDYNDNHKFSFKEIARIIREDVEIL